MNEAAQTLIQAQDNVLATHFADNQEFFNWSAEIKVTALQLFVYHMTSQSLSKSTELILFQANQSFHHLSIVLVFSNQL